MDFRSMAGLVRAGQATEFMEFWSVAGLVRAGQATRLFHSFTFANAQVFLLKAPTALNVPSCTDKNKAEI